MSQSGRPLSGFARPGTQGGRPGTMEQAIRTPRTAHTARPVTSASGRYVRLGTVSSRDFKMHLKLQYGSPCNEISFHIQIVSRNFITFLNSFSSLNA